MENRIVSQGIAVGVLCLLALSPSRPHAGGARGQAPDVPYRPMTSDDLLARLKAGRPMILIDCRPVEEFRAGHIPGARNVSIDSLSFGRDTVTKKAMEELWTRIGVRLPFILVDAESGEEYMPKSKLRELVALLPDSKNREVVFTCRRPECTRSPMAARWAAALGYTNIRRYEGGWADWSQKGLPVEKERAE